MSSKSNAFPLCSIVIRAYNEARHIARLLEGIRHQTYPNLEIILVDSGSTDDTIAIASSYGAKIVRIPADEFTFGRSLNLGINKAQGEWIVIASAHVYPVYPDWVERLVSPFSEARIGLTYGKQRGNEDSHFSEAQIFTQWYPDQSCSNQPHPFCNNANAAIRRTLWEKHAYDETLTGLEDLEWAKWAMEQGYAIAYVAEAEVIHVHHENPRSVYNRYRREAMAYKSIFPEERFSFWNFCALFATNAFVDLRQSLAQGKFLQHWKEILWFRWMQFWGTYQGYRHPGPVNSQLRKTFYYPRRAAADGRPLRREIPPIRYNENQPQPVSHEPLEIEE